MSKHTLYISQNTYLPLLELQVNPMLGSPNDVSATGEHNIYHVFTNTLLEYNHMDAE